MTPTPQPVTVALVGAGNRGQTYARWIAEHPERARLVAVADPRAHQRGLVVDQAVAARAGAPVGPAALAVDPAAVPAADPGAGRAVDPGAARAQVAEFATWRDLVAAGDADRAAGGTGRLADMVIVATQDREHRDPVVALAPQGYAILVEKPLAPSPEECRDVVYAVEASGVLFGVCHVMRYMPYTDLVKSVVDSGVLGEIVNVQHLEPVGWWHDAHSYVRGPWRSEKTSSPMLLAKSSHDLDWIRYVTGKRIATVASFGSLKHFRPEERPAGAADRCLDCPLEPTCPYSAPRLYLTTLREQGPIWPVSVITDATDEAGVVEALRTTDYGRCVYDSDNDVVDHQVVAMELEGGGAATFTMTAFSEQDHRKTQIFGTHGCLDGDGEKVRVTDFRDGSVTVHDGGHHGATNAADDHGGGDSGVMDAFVRAVATGDPSHVRSGAVESLQSHLAVFAAEESRHRRTVVDVPAR
ncbi:Gfo/Idh/MocA family protein [Cellulosimicrobium cellulans]|uniref:Gfo/Idh/MocA family protein n=1 Tax=Cellulosimicrobium cellulans TaxID=1710 RepID=UPI002406928A|nr:Gfo/Idh/MocA family oxidoreductase [Cellulosimicrobium cellulans]MDF9878197.1 putative dehydrogenase [Cellulosimicrobium cellulans]